MINKKLPKLDIGDIIRISKYKHLSAKGYLMNWTNVIFIVHKINSTLPRTYKLKDDTGNVFEAGFNEKEISKTEYGDIFLVERILKRKGY